MDGLEPKPVTPLLLTVKVPGDADKDFQAMYMFQAALNKLLESDDVNAKLAAIHWMHSKCIETKGDIKRGEA